MKLKVAPSMLSADFSKMGSEIERMQNAGADLIHCDVMDGMFVPNITFGPKMIADIRQHTNLMLDTHLMVVNPERYVDRFIDSGSDMITIHIEATDKAVETLKHIRSRGIKCGIVVNPETPVERAFKAIEYSDMVLLMSVHPGFGGQKFIPEVLDKLKIARKFMDGLGRAIDLEIDGGITLENISAIAECGANVIVAGSALFGADDVSYAMNVFASGGKVS